MIAALGTAAGRETALQAARLRVRVVDLFQGLAELVVFGAHPRHVMRIEAADRRLVASQQRMSRLRAAATAAFTLVSGAALYAVVFVAAGMTAERRLDGPLLALLVLAVIAAFDVLVPLLMACPQFGETREAARRLAAIVTAKAAVRFGKPSAGAPPDSNLVFESVWFRYPGRSGTALEAIDFRLPPGGRLAVLGHTGAGKSTLAGLLARFWDPDSGRILLGGLDLRAWDEPALRRTVAVVPQVVHVFEATLRDNLILARPGAADDRLFAVLKDACLLEWAQTLPRGLDTWLGSSGRRLSGGEARRLAVARAILQDAPLWILDEPSEGLDRVTARALIASLRRVTAEKSVLLITHRFEDLALADKILLLENGRVLERGTHRRLAGGPTRYAQLLRRL
jgi:ATP-binding cassette subfamily C protein CydC